MSRITSGIRNFNLSSNLLPDHLSVVYVMAPCAEGPCKIGVSSNVEFRLAALQIGCWLPLAVYGVRIAFRRDMSFGTLARSAEAGAFRIEGVCHKNLKECDVHLHGEWFDISARDALKAIEVSARKISAAALSIEDVLGLEIPEFDTSTRRAHEQVCASLVAVNKYVSQSLDRHENRGY